jgi:hypothetical protein
MFIKEICVGLGAALTVGIMRTVSLPLGPVLVAITGTSFILIWAALSHKNLRNFD